LRDLIKTVIVRSLSNARINEAKIKLKQGTDRSLPADAIDDIFPLMSGIFAGTPQDKSTSERRLFMLRMRSLGIAQGLRSITKMLMSFVREDGNAKDKMLCQHCF